MTRRSFRSWNGDDLFLGCEGDNQALEIDWSSFKSPDMYVCPFLFMILFWTVERQIEEESTTTMMRITVVEAMSRTTPIKLPHINSIDKHI